MTFLAWWVPWEPSFVIPVMFAASALLYVRGCVRLHVSRWRRLLFWLGFVLLYVALHTRLDYYAEHEFFVHRVQHLVLHHLGPFLIALSYPGAALRAALPESWRRYVLDTLLASAPVRRLLDVLLNPIVAALLFVGLIYLWLWPPVHFVAMLDARWYRVMNWSMVLDGLMFWWLVLDRRARPPARLAPGVRVLLALAVMVPQILLGAYITFSHDELYPIYALCGRAFAGISGATDQYLGGLILWIPSSMMSVVAALIAMRRWLALDTDARLR
ncbi:MAG: cytochrome c oxidase assembly protein, partial [Rhodanobacteraceae bacterium]